MGESTRSAPDGPAASDDPATPVRGPILDRLSAGVAIAGLLLLATNGAPPLAAYGTASVALACVGIGLLAGLVCYRLGGPRVLVPLWIGAGTAIALALALFAALLVAGRFEGSLVWAASLGAAVFGLGAAARAASAVYR